MIGTGRQAVENFVQKLSLWDENWTVVATNAMNNVESYS